jgi:hypothetical protein
MKQFFVMRNAHLIFVSALLFFLALNVIIGFTKGETVLRATWNGISELRPMDYLMFALFWYACAVHRPKDDWDSSFISLNLSQTNSEK